MAPGMLSAERHGLEGALSLAELAPAVACSVPAHPRRSQSPACPSGFSYLREIKSGQVAIKPPELKMRRKRCQRQTLSSLAELR